MEEDSSSKITMFFYLIKEGDVKEPINKYNIIPKKLYLIGRSKKDCDLVLDEKLLSRKHAELIYNNKNEIIIRDLDSRNGTYINKNRIEPYKDIIFSINDILSFGQINNQIVFYDYTEQKKEEYTDKDNYSTKNKNYNSIDRDKNFEKNKSKSDVTQRNNNINQNKEDIYYRNSKNKSRSNSKKNLSRSRSRSKETEKKNSRIYSGLEKLIQNIDERNREKSNSRKYNDRYNNRDEYYRNRASFGREKEKEKEEYQRRNDKYNNEYYEKTRRYYDDKKFENDFSHKNNNEDNGYIKCYVSGYMMLKIKKSNI